MRMERGAGISHLNWISGVPDNAPYFPTQYGRQSRLLIEEGGGVTRRHWVDCTDTVHIGRYSMVAGVGSQIFTHGVDMQENEQRARPVTIGPHSMVGSRAVLLGGAELPGFSALGAGSTLRSAFEETHSIYSGVPAVRVGSIDPEAKYFWSDASGQQGHRLQER
jgi:serine acetyltransferase